jgi:hypothetical protein
MTPFDRYRPAIAALSMATLQMALWVLAVSLAGRNPMPALLYGDDAARVHAATWAGLQITLSGAALVGACYRKRWLVVIGFGGLGLLFVVLAAAGFSAIPQGTVVAAMSSGAAPLCLVGAWLAWGRADGVR